MKRISVLVSSAQHDDMHGRLLSVAVVGLATEARKGEAGCQQPTLHRIDVRQLLLSIDYILYATSTIDSG